MGVPESSCCVHSPGRDRIELMSKRIRNSDPAAIGRARTLRATMGQTERLLWRRLRGKAAGFRFRRQYSVENFVLDFF